MYEDISVLFAVDQAHDFKYASFEYAKNTNKDHGRIEVRERWCASNPEYLNLIRGLKNWSGLQTIAMVIGTRILDGKETKRTRFYISYYKHKNDEGLAPIIDKTSFGFLL